MLAGAALAAASGCGGGTDAYFPLETGWRWDYAMTRVTMDGPKTQRYYLENLPPEPIDDGAEAVPRRTFDGNLYYYRDTENGIVRVGTHRAGEADRRAELPGRTVLAAPFEVGRAWRETVTTSVLEKTGPPQETLYRIQVEVPMQYTLESVDDTVEVPAGRYTGCLRIAGRGTLSTNVGNYIGVTTITVETTDWYAPGVGLVKSVRKERTSSSALEAGELELELHHLRKG